MSNFSYVALDPRGHETKGTLAVADQDEAIRRIKEMGCFPTRIVRLPKGRRDPAPLGDWADDQPSTRPVWKRALGRSVFPRRVKPRALSVFTRQTATLLEAGMPLLRGLRLLQEQERNPGLREVIQEISNSIESGSSFSEALGMHPKIFNRLYHSMVVAGETAGVLDVVLKRLSEFMEKAHRIKGKVVAAMFYPVAVLVVAIGLLGILLAFVVPRFKEVFESLMDGRPMPTFTLFVLGLSQAVRDNLLLVLIGLVLAALGFQAFRRTRPGRQVLDRFKLNMPLLGQLVSKAAIARFTRTLGTLLSSGVPILQALTIVKETAGNVVVGQAVATVHESVKEGESIAVPLRSTRVFPAMVVGMVDVGEQTGALPEMLMKIADTYDEEVDNSVAGLTSLLEPIMIILLAVVVGAIVIALFLPMIDIIGGMDSQRLEP